MLSGHLGKCQPLGIEGADTEGLSPTSQEEKQEHDWGVHGLCGGCWDSPEKSRSPQGVVSAGLGSGFRM